MTDATIQARLDELGLVLPAAPSPAASYQPWSKIGDVVYTAGQVPVVDGALVFAGRLGDELETADGQQAAAVAATNVLAVLDAAIGLERTRVCKVTVFVASTADFDEHHLVANGASERLAAVLGEHGVHARSAVGVAALPLGAPVEVEAVAVVRD
ncbi:MAG: RidA family protein [Nitriliruptoraceae bacterium]